MVSKRCIMQHDYKKIASLPIVTKMPQDVTVVLILNAI